MRKSQITSNEFNEAFVTEAPENSGCALQQAGKSNKRSRSN